MTGAGSEGVVTHPLKHSVAVNSMASGDFSLFTANILGTGQGDAVIDSLLFQAARFTGGDWPVGQADQPKADTGQQCPHQGALNRLPGTSGCAGWGTISGRRARNMRSNPGPSTPNLRSASGTAFAA